ncbi:hypothetical protein A2U01_0083582, partial [Trifolium medium]|nr:hypothetical protein [Trifolium medium]
MSHLIRDQGQGMKAH